MTLPDGNVTWPPKRFETYFSQLEEFDGWYTGDVEELAQQYRVQPIMHRAQYNGGVVGVATRAWLGKPRPYGEQRARLHIPLAADIATLSADYLFGEAPRVVLPGDREASESVARDGAADRRNPQQERVEQIINTPRFHSQLLESGEVAAALGGVYLRLVWNKERLASVMSEIVHADAAIPTFRFGRLESVIFWTELPNDDDDGKVWRHLEEHRPGVIEHGLYVGEDGKLGRRVPFEDRPETAWLAEPGIVNGSAEIIVPPTVTGLTAAYVPNMRPNKQYRKQSHLAMLGQSDFADVVQLFDAVDEVWASWMRDIRIAKARIVVAKQYLQSNGFGQGADFDYDREVYEGMTTLTDPNGAPFGFHAHQFNIRVTEHAETFQELRDQAMRSAGWTPASAGGDGTGLRTATEIHADERLSERTRDKKANYWKTLSQFFLTWLQLDAAVYGLSAPKEEPEFRFPAESQVDIEKMARTAQLLSAAKAASIETLVRMTRPDLDGQSLNDEVDRIKAENSIGSAADPTRETGLLDTQPTAADIERARAALERQTPTS